MAEARRGMGRGLAAILAVSERRGAEERPELRELPVELIAAEPVAAPPALRRRGARGARRLGPRARAAAADPRSAASRRHATRSSPASAAGAPRSSPGSTRSRRSCRTRDDAQTLEAALVENMAREDLNPVEEARAVAALVEELGLTREDAGRRIGRSRVAVSNLLRLLDLPDEVLELLEEGRLTEGHGRALLLADDHAARRRWRATPPREGWSVRVTRGARARGRTGRPPPRGPAHRGPSRPGRRRRGDRRRARRRRSAGRCRAARAGTGYKVELAFADVDEAIALARRVRSAAGA